MTYSQPDRSRPRWLVPGAAGAVAALALTACSSGSKTAADSATTASSSLSSSAGSTATSSAAASTVTPSTVASSTSASSTAANSSNPTSSAKLAEQLGAGISAVTSVHLTGRIASSAAGGTAGTIGADEKLSQGKVTAINLSETIGGQNIRLILIGTKAWAKLPTSTGPKPWLKVTSSSTNPTIRAVAASLSQTSSQTSLDGLVGFARAASNIITVGKETIDGVSSTHYAMTVATAKLPAASGKALAALGVKSVPTQMWIDGQGRPVRVSEKVTTSAVSTTTTLDLTKYNQSVTIVPPPAAQIGG